MSKSWGADERGSCGCPRSGCGGAAAGKQRLSPDSFRGLPTATARSCSNSVVQSRLQLQLTCITVAIATPGCGIIPGNETRDSLQVS